MKLLMVDRMTCSLSADLPDSMALEAGFARLAPLFEAVPARDGERCGALLVVSEDAGSATAVQFWRDALATGPALASPAAFPWCLANAPCGAVARRFGVTGANITWLVSSLDDPDAFEAPVAALAELAEGSGAASPSSPFAWLLALRLSAPSPRLVAWRFDVEGTGSASFGNLPLARRLLDGWLE